jgi:hypothetical protein
MTDTPTIAIAGFARITTPRRLAETDFAEDGRRKPEEIFHRLMQSSPPFVPQGFPSVKKGGRGDLQPGTKEGASKSYLPLYYS